MTTVGSVADKALEKMGADAWYPNDTSTQARPSWKDGNGWFYLPEGWEWNGFKPSYHYKNLVVEKIENKIYISFEDNPAQGFVEDTFPNAFRKAEQLLSSENLFWGSIEQANQEFEKLTPMEKKNRIERLEKNQKHANLNISRLEDLLEKLLRHLGIGEDEL